MGNSLKVSSHFGHNRLNWHLDEYMIGGPFVVKECAVLCLFERVGSQVEDLGNPKMREVLAPDCDPFRLLLEENHFPVLISAMRCDHE